MPPRPHQPLSESTLLARYLLLPSSLPTILPYNTFLTLLLPASTRNNTELQPYLRRLYADLQSQRNIDLATIRNNIARECARAGTVKAQLRRDLVRELDGGGDGYADDGNGNVNGDGQGLGAYYIDMKREASVELAPSRKRKRGIHTANDEGTDGSEASYDADVDADADQEAASPSASDDPPTDDNEESGNEDVDEEEKEADEDEIPESPHATTTTTNSSSMISVAHQPPAATTLTSAQAARLDALLDSSFYGARGLAVPSSSSAVIPAPQQRHHSKISLLKAMEAAVSALQREVDGLEAERGRVAGEVTEVVGGLSDLRYGTFGGRGSGAGGIGGGVEVEVQRGLGQLREVVERKVRDL